MQKLIYLICVCSIALSGMSGFSQSEETYPHCQILDESVDPLYSVSLSFLPEEQFGNYGKSSILELDADWAMAYFHDVLWGDIDLRPCFRAIVFMDSAGIQLPNQLMELSLDIGWTIRSMRGSAFQASVQPGIYSDIEEISSDVFFFPFSLAFIQSFNDQLSGVVGFDVRLGFDREFIPRAGLAWEPGERLRIEAGIPETRIDWFAGRLWSFHAGFEWLNSTYVLREPASLNRGDITLEDYRVYAGLSRDLTGNVKLICDLGHVFERNVSYERVVTTYSSDIDVDNGFFIRFGVAGPF